MCLTWNKLNDELKEKDTIFKLSTSFPLCFAKCYPSHFLSGVEKLITAYRFLITLLKFFLHSINNEMVNLSFHQKQVPNLLGKLKNKEN